MSRILKLAVDVLAPILIAALVWEALSRAGILNPVLVPPPSRILFTLYGLLGPGTATSGVKGILLKDLGVSLFRLCAALALAFGLGGLLDCGKKFAGPKKAEGYLRITLWIQYSQYARNSSRQVSSVTSKGDAGHSFCTTRRVKATQNHPTSIKYSIK